MRKFLRRIIDWIKGSDLGTVSPPRSSEYIRAMVFVYRNGARWELDEAIIHRDEGPDGKTRTSITPIRGRTRRPGGTVVDTFDYRWMHEVDADE